MNARHSFERYHRIHNALYKLYFEDCKRMREDAEALRASAARIREAMAVVQTQILTSREAVQNARALLESISAK